MHSARTHPHVPSFPPSSLLPLPLSRLPSPTPPHTTAHCISTFMLFTFLRRCLLFRCCCLCFRFAVRPLVSICTVVLPGPRACSRRPVTTIDAGVFSWSGNPFIIPRDSAARACFKPFLDAFQAVRLCGERAEHDVWIMLRIIQVSTYICAYVHLLAHRFLAEVHWWIRIPLRLRVGDEFE